MSTAGPPSPSGCRSPRPLGDRDQHDVHDPDARNQKRDGGNATQQRGEDLATGAPFRHFRLDVVHLEVVREVAVDVVLLAQKHGHLVLGLRDLVHTLRSHRNLIDGSRPLDIAVNRGIRCEQHHVLVVHPQAVRAAWF